MNKLSFGFCIAAALSTSSAMAADMPVKAAPAPLPVARNWTGFYVGIGGGYGMYDLGTQLTSTVTGLATNVPLDQGGRGWLGTAQIGFDYQIAPQWVIGAFVDGDISRIHGSHTGQNNAIGLIAGDMSLDRSWAVGGKIGYLVDPSLLTFVSGGFTQAHFKGTTYLNFNGTPTGLAVPDQTYDGFFIGGGAEYALGFIPGLYLKSEYRFADYGTKTLDVFATATGVPTGVGERTHPYVQTVRTDLVWRFGAGPLAMASAMPVKAAPAPVARSWTGFYVGVGGGYGMYDLDTQLTSTVTGLATNVPLDQGGRGWLGTAQVGFDYQLAPRWVLGAFVDGDISRIHGSHTGQNNAQVGLVAGDMSLDRSWAVGGKIGYLVDPSLLTFVSGGFTQAHFKGTTYVNFTGTPTGLGVPDQTYDGFFVGGGAEYALGFIVPGLYLKSEYRFADYDTKTLDVFATATGVPTGVGERTHPRVQTVRTELVWRFGG